MKKQSQINVKNSLSLNKKSSLQQENNLALIAEKKLQRAFEQYYLLFFALNNYKQKSQWCIYKVINYKGQVGQTFRKMSVLLREEFLKMVKHGVNNNIALHLNTDMVENQPELIRTEQVTFTEVIEQMSKVFSLLPKKLEREEMEAIFNLTMEMLIEQHEMELEKQTRTASTIDAVYTPFVFTKSLIDYLYSSIVDSDLLKGKISYLKGKIEHLNKNVDAEKPIIKESYVPILDVDVNNKKTTIKWWEHLYFVHMLIKNKKTWWWLDNEKDFEYFGKGRIWEHLNQMEDIKQIITNYNYYFFVKNAKAKVRMPSYLINEGLGNALLHKFNVFNLNYSFIYFWRDLFFAKEKDVKKMLDVPSSLLRHRYRISLTWKFKEKIKQWNLTQLQQNKKRHLWFTYKIKNLEKLIQQNKKKVNKDFSRLNQFIYGSQKAKCVTTHKEKIHFYHILNYKNQFKKNASDKFIHNVQIKKLYYYCMYKKYGLDISKINNVISKYANLFQMKRWYRTVSTQKMSVEGSITTLKNIALMLWLKNVKLNLYLFWEKFIRYLMDWVDFTTYKSQKVHTNKLNVRNNNDIIDMSYTGKNLLVVFNVFMWNNYNFLMYNWLSTYIWNFISGQFTAFKADSFLSKKLQIKQSYDRNVDFDLWGDEETDLNSVKRILKQLSFFDRQTILEEVDRTFLSSIVYFVEIPNAFKYIKSFAIPARDVFSQWFEIIKEKKLKSVNNHFFNFYKYNFQYKFDKRLYQTLQNHANKINNKINEINHLTLSDPGVILYKKGFDYFLNKGGIPRQIFNYLGNLTFIHTNLIKNLEDSEFVGSLLENKVSQAFKDYTLIAIVVNNLTNRYEVKPGFRIYKQVVKSELRHPIKYIYTVHESVEPVRSVTQNGINGKKKSILNVLNQNNYWDFLFLDRNKHLINSESIDFIDRKIKSNRLLKTEFIIGLNKSDKLYNKQRSWFFNAQPLNFNLFARKQSSKFNVLNPLTTLLNNLKVKFKLWKIDHFVATFNNIFPTQRNVFLKLKGGIRGKDTRSRGQVYKDLYHYVYITTLRNVYKKNLQLYENLALQEKKITIKKKLGMDKAFYSYFVNSWMSRLNFGVKRKQNNVYSNKFMRHFLGIKRKSLYLLDNKNDKQKYFFIWLDNAIKMHIEKTQNVLIRKYFLEKTRRFDKMKSVRLNKKKKIASHKFEKPIDIFKNKLKEFYKSLEQYRFTEAFVFQQTNLALEYGMKAEHEVEEGKERERQEKKDNPLTEQQKVEKERKKSEAERNVDVLDKNSMLFCKKIFHFKQYKFNIFNIYYMRPYHFFKGNYIRLRKLVINDCDAIDRNTELNNNNTSIHHDDEMKEKSFCDVNIKNGKIVDVNYYLSNIFKLNNLKVQSEKAKSKAKSTENKGGYWINLKSQQVKANKLKNANVVMEEVLNSLQNIFKNLHVHLKNFKGDHALTQIILEDILKILNDVVKSCTTLAEYKHHKNIKIQQDITALEKEVTFLLNKFNEVKEYYIQTNIQNSTTVQQIEMYYDKIIENVNKISKFMNADLNSVLAKRWLYNSYDSIDTKQCSRHVKKAFQNHIDVMFKKVFEDLHETFVKFVADFSEDFIWKKLLERGIEKLLHIMKYFISILRDGMIKNPFDLVNPLSNSKLISETRSGGGLYEFYTYLGYCKGLYDGTEYTVTFLMLLGLCLILFFSIVMDKVLNIALILVRETPFETKRIIRFEGDLVRNQSFICAKDGAILNYASEEWIVFIFWHALGALLLICLFKLLSLWWSAWSQYHQVDKMRLTEPQKKIDALFEAIGSIRGDDDFQTLKTEYTKNVLLQIKQLNINKQIEELEHGISQLVGKLGTPEDKFHLEIRQNLAKELLEEVEKIRNMEIDKKKFEEEMQTALKIMKNDSHQDLPYIANLDRFCLDGTVFVDMSKRQMNYLTDFEWDFDHIYHYISTNSYAFNVYEDKILAFGNYVIEGFFNQPYFIYLFLYSIIFIFAALIIKTIMWIYILGKNLISKFLYSFLYKPTLLNKAGVQFRNYDYLLYKDKYKISRETYTLLKANRFNPKITSAYSGLYSWAKEELNINYLNNNKDIQLMYQQLNEKYYDETKQAFFGTGLHLHLNGKSILLLQKILKKESLNIQNKVLTDMEGWENRGNSGKSGNFKLRKNINDLNELILTQDRSVINDYILEEHKKLKAAKNISVKKGINKLVYDLYLYDKLKLKEWWVKNHWRMTVLNEESADDLNLSNISLTGEDFRKTEFKKDKDNDNLNFTQKKGSFFEKIALLEAYKWHESSLKVYENKSKHYVKKQIKSKNSNKNWSDFMIYNLKWKDLKKHLDSILADDIASKSPEYLSIKEDLLKLEQLEVLVNSSLHWRIKNIHKKLNAEQIAIPKILNLFSNTLSEKREWSVDKFVNAIEKGNQWDEKDFTLLTFKPLITILGESNVFNLGRGRWTNMGSLFDEVKNLKMNSLLYYSMYSKRKVKHIKTPEAIFDIFGQLYYKENNKNLINYFIGLNFHMECVEESQNNLKLKKSSWYQNIKNIFKKPKIQKVINNKRYLKNKAELKLLLMHSLVNNKKTKVYTNLSYIKKGKSDWIFRMILSNQ